MSAEIAQSGWVIQVVVTMADGGPEARFFAVGIAHAAEAEEAVLRFPGLLPEDSRIARRPLSPTELAGLGLRTQAVRPYRGVVEINGSCDIPPEALSRALATRYR